MDEEKVVALTRELDAEVPREGAVVKLHQYGGGPDEGQIVANRLGYLRLGVEFLKAGFAEEIPGKIPAAIEVDLKYLLTGDSTIRFDWFERREVPPMKFHRPSAADQIVPFAVMAVLGLGVILSFVGLFTVIKWIW